MEVKEKSHKKLLLIVALGLVVVGLTAVYLLTRSDSPAPQTQSEVLGFDPPGACDVLTLEDAQRAIGEQAQVPEDNGSPGASSDDIEVSQCIYQTPITNVEAVKSQKSASLLVRGAKTETGANSNREVFLGTMKPEGVVDIDGYGEAAFWNPQFGQLNILKSDNWYILSVGPINPAEKKIEDAKKLAEALQESL